MSDSKRKIPPNVVIRQNSQLSQKPDLFSSSNEEDIPVPNFEERDHVETPLSFPAWLYVLFIVAISLLFVVPWGIQYFPHEEVKVEITNANFPNNRIYSSKYGIYYFVDDKTHSRTKKLPNWLLYPLHNAAGKVIENKTKICNTSSVREFSALVDIDYLVKHKEKIDLFHEKQKNGSTSKGVFSNANATNTCVNNLSSNSNSSSTFPSSNFSLPDFMTRSFFRFVQYISRRKERLKGVEYADSYTHLKAHGQISSSKTQTGASSDIQTDAKNVDQQSQAQQIERQRRIAQEHAVWIEERRRACEDLKRMNGDTLYYRQLDKEIEREKELSLDFSRNRGMNDFIKK